jgi:hypothetical protein
MTFQVVKSQLNVISDQDRNPHASWLPVGHTVIFELPEKTAYIEDIDSGEGLLPAHDNESGTQDNETGGDGLLHDHAGNSQTGEGHGSGDHDCTEDDTDHNLSNNDNH